MKQISIIIPLIFILLCSKSEIQGDKKQEAIEINKKAMAVANESPNEALELFKKAAILDPQNPDYVNNQGAIYLTLKQFDKAIPLFNSAIQKEGKYSRGYYNLGVSYAEMGDFKESIKNYKKAIQFSTTENPEIHFNLGVAYTKLKKKKEAIQEFKLFLAKAQTSNQEAVEVAKKRIQELEKK